MIDKVKGTVERDRAHRSTPFPMRAVRLIVARISRSPRLSAAIGILGVGLLIAILVVRPMVLGSQTIDGWLKLYQTPNSGIADYSSDSDGACAGVGGYADLVAGVPVTVKDAGGKVIGSSVLERGHIDLDLSANGGPFAMCRFDFRLSSLPETEFYTVAIGHRGEITYSQADLELADWHIEPTIGP